MEVFLLKEGQRFGPYSPEEVKSLLDAGDFSESDLAFFEGCDGWVSITLVPGVSPEVEEDFDDPDVDYDRQRELADMFPDPDDDFFDEDEEDEYDEDAMEDAPPSPPPQEIPPTTPSSPEPSQPPIVNIPEPAHSPSDPATSDSAPARRPNAAGASRGKRFSLSQAQAAIHGQGNKRRGKPRGGIPFPRRPGVAAFIWLIFFALLFGVCTPFLQEVDKSSEFVHILGGLHPLINHLPVGALLLAFPMQLCDRPGLFRHIGAGSTFVLWFAMIGSVLSVFAGYCAVPSQGFSPTTYDAHATLGILVASGACGALFLKLLARRFGEIWLHHLCSVMLFATSVTLAFAMHTGSSLTHGEDYLKPTATTESDDEGDETDSEQPHGNPDDNDTDEIIEDNPFPNEQN